jgi:hypothetical protein
MSTSSRFGLSMRLSCPNKAWYLICSICLTSSLHISSEERSSSSILRSSSSLILNLARDNGAQDLSWPAAASELSLGTLHQTPF